MTSQTLNPTSRFPWLAPFLERLAQYVPHYAGNRATSEAQKSWVEGLFRALDQGYEIPYLARTLPTEFFASQTHTLMNSTQAEREFYGWLDAYHVFERVWKKRAALQKEIDTHHSTSVADLMARLEQMTDLEELDDFLAYLKLSRGKSGETSGNDTNLPPKPEDKRKWREMAFQKGILTLGKGSKVKPNTTFGKYFDTSEAVRNLYSRDGARKFADIRKGWIEEELTLALHWDGMPEGASKRSNDLIKGVFKKIRDAIEDEAFQSIRRNLSHTLETAPLGRVPVLGVNPAGKAATPAALLNEQGNYVFGFSLQLDSEEKRLESVKIIQETLAQHPFETVAVAMKANYRAIESFLRQTFLEMGKAIPVVLMPPIGLQAYGTGDLGRKEFPNLEPFARGSVSLGRRLQDPISEISKLGLGDLALEFNHYELSQDSLKKQIDRMIRAAVHSQKHDIQTVHESVLSWISGVGPEYARYICELRDRKEGGFQSLADLESVEGFVGPRLTQASQFLGFGLTQEQAQAKSLNAFDESLLRFEDLHLNQTVRGIVTNRTQYGVFIDIGVQQDGLLHTSKFSGALEPGDWVDVKIIELNAEKKLFSLASVDYAVRAIKPRFQVKLPPKIQAKSSPGGNSANQSRPQVTAAQNSRGGSRDKPRNNQPQGPKFQNNPFAALSQLKSKKDD